MKKETFISICIAALAGILVSMTLILLLSGCTEYDISDSISPREASVRINIANANTRAAETDINNAIVLVYNASQVFEKSGNTNSSNSITFTLREGKKYIFAVANPGATLRAKLEASPTYTSLMDMLSEADDYKAEQIPAQGMLMSGNATETISADDAHKTVNVELTFCTARIDLYIRKGSSDVDNITINSATLTKARSKGYLFNSVMSTATVNNNVSLINSLVSTNTADGTLIGTQYTYPTVNATDIAFNITVQHANASTTDTYTIYLNNDNASSPGSTLSRGKQYKVLVTFSKDETGSLSITAYTSKTNDFVIG